MNGRFKAAVLVLLAASALLASCNSLILKGRVSLKGSEPHTYLVLVSEEERIGTKCLTLGRESWSSAAI